MNRILKGRNGSGVLRAVYALGLALCATGGFGQGALTPPGAPAPGMKTLQQIEPRTPIESVPFTILTPGSYYLTRNLTAFNANEGIIINASNVTVDLSGFRLSGFLSTAPGISVPSPQRDIVIRNGIIASFGKDGIDARNADACVFSDLRLSNNGLQPGTWFGLAAGADSIVTGCTAEGNRTGGFHLAGGGVIDRCLAIDNGGNGYQLLLGGVVTSCVARENTGSGFAASNEVTISDSTAWGNESHGFFGHDGVVVTGCTARSNGDDGIFVQQGGAVSGCAASYNAGDGITATFGSMVRDSVSASNTAHGFRVEADSRVEACTSTSNGDDGIYLGADSAAIGNLCAATSPSSGGAGIRAGSSGARIEGNECRDNATGIAADAAGNLIVRNIAHGNSTNYSFVAGNRYGPVVNITGAGTPLVSGSSAAGTMSSTDPWANFAF